jgi:hypothetical protein
LIATASLNTHSVTPPGGVERDFRGRFCFVAIDYNGQTIRTAIFEALKKHILREEK